ncbi:hypothetical protein HZA56_19780 [Candidatus Poribacteria bacterium]|nr:hypothetical protein [Candidatus Poribacteria bacterium]
MSRIYVIDTSYLLELFAVPGFSTEQAVKTIQAKFKEAIQARSQLIVPLGCLFELANHIADVPDVGQRLALVEKLTKAVESSVATAQPWQISPPDKLDIALPRMFAEYAKTYLPQGMGLTDTYTLEEALRLRRKYSPAMGCMVHIWTKDRILKAHEPDKEPNPFVG